jgi:pyridoxine 4-dehydrogenase
MTTITAAAAGNVSFADVEVNRLGFGAMRITGEGIWGPPPDREVAKRVLQRAVELGVQLIDTADSYGPYVSEELIAEALYPYPDDLLIATKGGLERPGPGQWTPNGRPEHLREACEGSLKRLRLERIDVYQMHRPDPAVPYEESIGALKQLQDEGKIRHIGLSNVEPEHIETARSVVDVVSIQNRYSLTDREHEDVLQICERDGMPFLPWFPLGAGKLAEPGGPLDRIAQARDATLPQIALAWLLRHSPVLTPIPGTGNPAHLEENIAAAGIELTDDEYTELERAAAAES